MKPHHLMPLLLSAAAHAGAGLVLAFNGGPGNAMRGEGMPARSLMVTLKAPDDFTTNRHPSFMKPEASFPARAHLAEERRDAPGTGTDARILPVQALPEPHYFRLSELTEKPRVVKNIDSSLMVVAQDIAGEAAVLRLFINDEGSVDKVDIEESRLPAHAARRIVEAFSGIRFEPGKIGRLSVRSQLRIQISLQNDSAA